MDGEFFLDHFLSPLHLFILNADELVVDACYRHLVLLSVHFEHFTLLVFVTACVHLNEVVFYDVPPFYWFLDWGPGEAHLRVVQQRGCFRSQN